MQFRKDSTGYWLVLEKGEEVKSAIEEWAKKEGIAGAAIFGIGAVEDIELAAYMPKTRQMARKKFPGAHELLCLAGNISESGLHAHIAIAGSSFRVHGGHLERARIAALGEFFIIPSSRLSRVPDAALGLRKIDLAKK